MEEKIGQYAFIIGVIIAVVLGLSIPPLADATPLLISLLIILGLIVGFLNVAGKETKEFLIVGVILVLISYAGGAGTTLSGVRFIGSYLQGIFQGLMGFIIPAIVVVSLKDVWKLAKGGE